MASPSFGEIVLVRHGQQEMNRSDPLQPKSGNSPLSELGRVQAQAVAEELSAETVDAIYSSDLLRAHMTATAVAERLGLEVSVDPALRELGIYRDVPSGRTIQAEIGDAGVALVRQHFLADRSWDAFPLTEPREERHSRVSGALTAILAAHEPSSKVVVVCHGGVINLIVQEVIGGGPDMLYYPAHASISRIGRGEDRLGVVSLNERSHLMRYPGSSVTY